MPCFAATAATATTTTPGLRAVLAGTAAPLAKSATNVTNYDLLRHLTPCGPFFAKSSVSVLLSAPYRTSCFEENPK
jgi:hypothetical protein